MGLLGPIYIRMELLLDAELKALYLWAMTENVFDRPTPVSGYRRNYVVVELESVGKRYFKGRQSLTSKPRKKHNNEYL